MNELTWLNYLQKAELFPFHSYKYLDDAIEVEVLLDTSDILLIQKKATHDEPNELLWATSNFESLIKACEAYPQHVVKFIPDAWVEPLLQSGFVMYGELREYWINPLTVIDEEIPMDFAVKKDALAISHLTKANRLYSREFLGEEPKFIIDWLTINEDGVNFQDNRYPAMIVEKKQDEFVGVCFVGLYGFSNPQGPTLWIRKLAVSPKYHGQGYGRKLLKKALIYGVRHGAKRSFLMADDLNKRAIHLYQSLGFVAKMNEAQIDMLTRP